MTAGRPPKPTELKRLLGNPGQRPLPDLNNITHLPMAREIPAYPDTLGEPGKKLWDRAWTMAVTWLSPITDIDAISNAAFWLMLQRQQEINIWRPLNLQMLKRLWQLIKPTQILLQT